MSKRGFRDNPRLRSVEVDGKKLDPASEQKEAPWGGPAFRFTANQRSPAWPKFRKQLKRQCAADKGNTITGRHAHDFQDLLDGTFGFFCDVQWGLKHLAWLRKIEGWAPDETEKRYPIYVLRVGGENFGTLEPVRFKLKPTEAVLPRMGEPDEGGSYTIEGNYYQNGEIAGKRRYGHILVGAQLLIVPIENVHRITPETQEPDVVYDEPVNSATPEVSGPPTNLADVDKAVVEGEKAAVQEKLEGEDMYGR